MVSKAENQLIFQIWSRDREIVPKSGESRFMGESWQVWCFNKTWYKEVQVYHVYYNKCTPLHFLCVLGGGGEVAKSHQKI